MKVGQRNATIADAAKRTILACLELHGRRATEFITRKLVVKATVRRPFRSRGGGVEMVVTFGRPNFREREFLKKRRGVPAGTHLKGWGKKSR